MKEDTTIPPHVRSDLDEKLAPVIRAYVESEVAKIYAYVVKNLRYVVLGLFGFLIMASAAFAAVCVFVTGIMLNSGSGAASVGLAMWIMGAVLLLGVAGFLAVVLSQKFWLKTFKLDKIVKSAQERGGTFVHGGPLPQV